MKEIKINHNPITSKNSFQYPPLVELPVLQLLLTPNVTATSVLIVLYFLPIYQLLVALFPCPSLNAPYYHFQLSKTF